MEDVKALIGDTCDEPDEVVLTSEEDQKWHLGHSEPSSTKP